MTVIHYPDKTLKENKLCIHKTTQIILKDTDEKKKKLEKLLSPLVSFP